jgi:hypothetical protein
MVQLMGSGDLAAARLAGWGRVLASNGRVPWLVVDAVGAPLEPIEVFFRGPHRAA